MKRPLEELHITLTRQELRMDAGPLLTTVLGRFFGGHGGFIDVLAGSVPSPVAANPAKIKRFWRGDLTGEVGGKLCACDEKAPLAGNVVRMLPSSDAHQFLALARIFSGTIKAGDEVDVLGER
jgi:U5 small nuclear ribonucleoprotein component